MPTTSTPVTTGFNRGRTVADFIQALNHPPKHSYPYRVFMISGDSTPYYSRSFAIFHVSSRRLWIGRCEFRQRMVPVPAPLRASYNNDFSPGSPFYEEVTATALVEYLARAWLNSSVGRLVGHEQDSQAPLYRELLPHVATELPDAFVPQACLPVDYFDALRSMWGHRMDAAHGVATRWIGLIHSTTTRRSSVEVEPRVQWRGMLLTRGDYMLARKWFRDPDYIEAVRQAKEEGDYDDLRDYWNDWHHIVSRMPSATLERMLKEHSDRELKLCDCGHVENVDNAVTTRDGGHTYCGLCASEEFVETVDGGLYHRDDVYYWESDGEYHRDPEPEYDDDDDDDDSGLLDAWSSSTGHLAHDRSFTPSTYGDFTMGVELEVETEGSRSADLRECDDHFNADMTYAMFKRDGSLSGSRGFEIVTAARKLDDHIRMFKEWVVPSDLRAWQAGNCGMHVHIDSRAFTALHLGRFLQLYNDPANREFIKAIAGRHPDTDRSADSYAQRLDKPINLNPATIKKGAGTSRYRMVNLTNLTDAEARRLDVQVSRDSKGSYSTVEIRIFKATLKKERLLAQIEFAHASVAYTRVAGNHQLNGKAFIEWLGTVAGQYKHLARWFNVYVPRPTKQRPTVRTNNVPEFA